MAVPNQIRLREATEADLGFIFDSWLESYRRESAWAAHMSSNIFFPNHRNLVRELVQRCIPVIACNHDDPLHLAGFMCAERIQGIFVVHYAYVKFSLREYGIGSAMARAYQYDGNEQIIASHWTKTAIRIAQRKRALFNPYLLFQQFSGEMRHGRDSRPTVAQGGSIETTTRGTA
jgi:hypothetical protein